MKKETKRNIFISIFILSLIISFIMLRVINKKISPLLLEHAELETKRISTIIINNAVSEQLKDNTSLNELFTIVKNSSNEIQTIDFNSALVNRTLRDITNTVLSSLKSIENGDISSIDGIMTETSDLKKGIIVEIPIGVVTNNVFLSNFGPKIPIKLNVIGSVDSNIKTNIRGYGINNALMEVYVSVEVDLQVNIPFISKRTAVITDVPILIKIIQGEVPKFYGGNLLRESNITSIPSE